MSQPMAKRYYAISEYYKERFGEKVQKIPVSTATDCPNRLGLKGMETCAFCDVWGSAAYIEQREMDLSSQIVKYKEFLGTKYKVKTFLAYFQAYTNTFIGLPKLKQNFDLVLSDPQIQGIIVGTRPDCISPAVLNLWKEFHQKTYLSVELGVQSFFEDQVKFLKRGHTVQDSIEAIKKIKTTIDLDLGIHLIFGTPGETEETIIQTAEIVSSLPIDNVKLHNLHVLKNTHLEKLYLAGEFQPIELDEYAEKVVLFLRHLHPRVRVHRLGAMSNRWDELLAPEWTRYKMGTYQYILDKIKYRDAHQGDRFKSLENAIHNRLEQHNYS
ncbi:MAG: TIGR01212 family radical SAM protein [Bdellovibrionales bacterium]